MKTQMTDYSHLVGKMVLVKLSTDSDGMAFTITCNDGNCLHKDRDKCREPYFYKDAVVGFLEEIDSGFLMIKSNTKDPIENDDSYYGEIPTIFINDRTSIISIQELVVKEDQNDDR